MNGVDSRYTWLVRHEDGRWLTVKGFVETPERSALLTGEVALALVAERPDVVLNRYFSDGWPEFLPICIHPTHPTRH